MRLVPPLLNPTKGGLRAAMNAPTTATSTQASNRQRRGDRRALIQSQSRCSAVPARLTTLEALLVLSQGWCQPMTKAMRGARHPIRRSHTELRECCQSAAGRNMGCCRGGNRAGTAISARCTGSGRYVRSMGRGSEKGGICCFVERRKEKKGQD